MMQLTMTYRWEWPRPDDIVDIFEFEMPGRGTVKVEDMSGCGFENGRVKQALLDLLSRIEKRENLFSTDKNTPLSRGELLHQKGLVNLSDQEVIEIEMLLSIRGAD